MSTSYNVSIETKTFKKKEETNMLNYIIHLSSISDYTKYIRLLGKIAFSGHISGKGFNADADDILWLFAHCPSDCLTLTINCCRREDIKAIEEYLKKSGLLNSVPSPDGRKHYHFCEAA